MKWRLRHWPAAHFSTASMVFEQTDKGAKMTLEQSGVPESDIERTKQEQFKIQAKKNQSFFLVWTSFELKKGMERILLESDQIYIRLWNQRFLTSVHKEIFLFSKLRTKLTVRIYAIFIVEIQCSPKTFFTVFPRS